MKSKRSSRRKPVPAILRVPIKESDFPEDQTVAEQIESRLQAVFDYYDIKRSDPSSAFQLVHLLARDHFPMGFRRVRNGTPRTNKRKWTCYRKTHLVEFIEEHQERGMSQEEAARLYIRRHCPERSSAKGLVAEFHRAEKWSRLGKLTEQERHEVDALLRRERQRWRKKNGLPPLERRSRNAPQRRSYEVTYAGRTGCIQWYENRAPTAEEIEALFGHK